MPASPPLELEVFTAREMPRVVGSLALYCGDRDVAEELAQEALVRVCRDWEQVKAMEHPGAWLHRVAINLAHSHYRRRQAGRRARRRVEARAGVPALLPDTADALAVRDALARLPDRHRRVLVLRYWADLSMAETAVALDVSLSAAKSRASRATAALPAGGAQPLDQVANVIDRAGEARRSCVWRAPPIGGGRRVRGTSVRMAPPTGWMPRPVTSWPARLTATRRG